MNMNKIYKKIAQESGTDAKTVKREIAAAITDAYENADADSREILASISGEKKPTTEDLIMFCIMSAVQNDMDTFDIRDDGE